MKRFVSDIPFPPYAYIPGRYPHPTHDPAGHSYRKAPVPSPFLYGVDLFHHGFFWEAHEQWESIWRPLAKSSDQALLMQALILLAASGVKKLEANEKGAQGHCDRAKILLTQLGGFCWNGLCAQTLRMQLDSAFPPTLELL